MKKHENSIETTHIVRNQVDQLTGSCGTQRFAVQTEDLRLEF